MMINISLPQSVPAVVLALLICICILLFYFAGHRFRKLAIKKNPLVSSSDLGPINGTLLGLLGLLLAFTFSMASSRFDARRTVVIEEANDIGTVILRTDFYPDSVRNILRQHLQQYVEARIGYYQAGTDYEKTKRFYISADSISKKIWGTAVSYAKTDYNLAKTSELIPALNAMIDVTTTRRAAGEATIPGSIMYFLIALCFCAAFLLGYDNKNHIDPVLTGGFAVMLSITIFCIKDLDSPRSGLITMDSPNEKIVELRDMFR